jgi:hypothetical protein
MNRASRIAGIAAASLIAAVAAYAQNAEAPAKPDKPAKPEKWIGVRVGGLMPMIRPHLKKQLAGMPEDVGLMVWDVTPNSPAVVAGIERFDILLRADGVPVTKPETLQEILNRRNFATSVRLDLIHEGQAKTVHALVLEKPEGEAGLAGRGGGPGGGGPGGGGPGGGRSSFFSQMQSTVSFTDPDGNQQRMSGEQMMDFWRKMREDEKFRETVSRKGITINLKYNPPPPPAEGTDKPNP